MCEPETVNGPPWAPLTVPAVVVPSPQSMAAVKSLASPELVSVKVATAPLKAVPSVALKVMGLPVRVSASVAVSVPVLLMLTPLGASSLSVATTV